MAIAYNEGAPTFGLNLSRYSNPAKLFSSNRAAQFRQVVPYSPIAFEPGSFISFGNSIIIDR